MPLEIRELHLRVTVNQPLQGQQQAAPSTGPKEKDEEREEIILQCIDDVMEIIKKKKER